MMKNVRESDSSWRYFPFGLLLVFFLAASLILCSSVLPHRQHAFGHVLCALFRLGNYPALLLFGLS